MSPTLATLVFALGIGGLFWLDRDCKAKTSIALWIPVVWMGIACSRAASLWFQAFGWGSVEVLDSPDQYLDGSPFDRNVFAVLLLLGIWVLVQRRKQVGPLLRANWPILLFFFYCAFSFFWSDYPAVAAKRWIKAVGNLLMIVVVVTDPNRSAAIRRFLARVAFVMVPISVLFIKYYPDLGRGYSRWTYQPFYVGVTDNKNGLGTLCLILGAASVWRLFESLREKKSVRNRVLIAHGLVISMVVWLLWMANSMTSIACLVMASALIAVTHLSFVAKRIAIVHLLVFGMVAVSLYALFLDTGGGLIGTLGRDPTLTGRTELWHNIIAMTSNPLIGTGFESFWLGKRLDKLWSIYWWHPNEAHNGYLEFYLTLGWIGIVLWAAVMVTGYRTAISVFRTDQETGRVMLAYLLIGTIYNVSEAAFKGTDPIWIIFFFGALAVPMYRASKTPSSQSKKSALSAALKPEASEIFAEGTRVRGVGAGRKFAGLARKY